MNQQQTLKLGPEFLHDPFPTLASLRETAAVQRVVLPDGAERWIVTRYEDVRRLLTDQRLSSELDRAAPTGGAENNQAAVRRDETVRNAMINRDPPVHTRQRKVVVRAFSARRVDNLRPSIEKLTHELLDRMDSNDPVDLVEQFALPLPVGVICELLGVPTDERPYFGTRMDAMLASRTPQDALKAVGELKEYIAEKLRGKRENPTDDLLTALIEVSDEEGRLSEGELAAMSLQLLFAGHATTVYLIGAGILQLLTHRDQYEALVRDPSLVGNAVDELLRFDGPVLPGVFRYATEPIEVDGTVIPEGSLVLLALSAANRDPAQFPDPDRLDVSRPDANHLAFGHGIHYCLGARLAQVEGQIALKALVERYPQLTLAKSADEIQWKPLSFMRSLASLPVLLHGV